MPLLALLGTAILWVDARYMHKEIAQSQLTILRYELATEKVKSFARREEAGEVLSADEIVDYEQAKAQLAFIQQQYHQMTSGLPE